MPRKIIAQIAILVSVFFLSIGLQSFAAFRQPTVAPPNANASAPLNVGNTAQTKTGSLTVGNTAINNTLYAIQASKPIYTANYVQAGSSAINWSGYGLSTTLPIYSSSYIRTHSSVRSPNYCNEAGTVCKSATALVSGGGGGGFTHFATRRTPVNPGVRYWRNTTGNTALVMFSGSMYGNTENVYYSYINGRVIGNSRSSSYNGSNGGSVSFLVPAGDVAGFRFVNGGFSGGGYFTYWY
ncbi:hypothetical protein MNBD_CPR01-120 [hydrothermal vent metagenome]|uniref:Uncharacterized protein n=1 Tax=hydrothermal vent metagenome TaxID=652676 RepID=A0A3B0UWG2_9ZZZZ